MARARSMMCLHVVVAVGDHGPCSPSSTPSTGMAAFELTQDFVTHELVVGAVGGAGRLAAKQLPSTA